MKYSVDDLYQYFARYYSRLLHQKHKVKEISFSVVEDLETYKKRYPSCMKHHKKFRYIAPAGYCEKPFKSIIVCAELINKYVKNYPKFISNLFIEYLIVHESLHCLLLNKFNNYDVEEDEIHKITLRDYTISHIIGETILIGGLKRRIKLHLLLAYCIITGKKRKKSI